MVFFVLSLSLSCLCGSTRLSLSCARGVLWCLSHTVFEDSLLFDSFCPNKNIYFYSKFLNKKQSIFFSFKSKLSCLFLKFFFKSISQLSFIIRIQKYIDISKKLLDNLKECCLFLFKIGTTSHLRVYLALSLLFICVLKLTIKLETIYT